MEAIDSLELSPEAFDTVRNIVIVPVSPWHIRFVPNYLQILQDKTAAGHEPIGRYKCKKCNDTVTPVRGMTEERRWHFRHLAGTKCSNREFTAKGESAEHLMSNVLIYNFISRGGILNARCKCGCGDMISENKIKLEKGQEITLNYPVDPNNKRLHSDIGIYEGDKTICIIEIKHTYKTTFRPEPWYEFSTSDIIPIAEQFTSLDYIQITDVRDRQCIKCKELELQKEETKRIKIAEAKCKDKEKELQTEKIKIKDDHQQQQHIANIKTHQQQQQQQLYQIDMTLSNLDKEGAAAFQPTFKFLTEQRIHQMNKNRYLLIDTLKSQRNALVLNVTS